MKERLSVLSSVLVIFIFGCLFGGYALWMNLRINGLANDHAAFKQNVEQFAKQVNEEFKKISEKTESK